MKKRILILLIFLLLPAAGCVQKNGQAEAEPVRLKWCVFGERQPDHDRVLEEINRELRDALNVELDLEVIPASQFDDKMRLMSTSGEPYDLTFTSVWKNSFDENLARGEFLCLDGLFEKYAPEIREQMPEWLEEAGRSGGRLYAIPNPQVAARQIGFIVQKKYADRYGLTERAMERPEDIEPFLEKIVENEPDMIPADIRDHYITEMEYEDFASGMVWVSKEEPYRALPVTEVSGAQIAFVRDWYEKGFLRKDIATITDNSMDVAANRYICTMSVFKPGLGAEWTARNGVEYIAIPVGGTYRKAVSGNEAMTAVSADSRHPEKAVQLLNYLYQEPELFNKLLFGLEGEHYRKTGADSVELISGSGYCYGTEAWKFGSQFLAWRLPGQEKDVWEKTVQMNEEAEGSKLRGFSFNPEPVREELVSLNEVMERAKGWQYIQEEPGKYMEKWKLEMEEAGVLKVTEEVQRQIDIWLTSSPNGS